MDWIRNFGGKFATYLRKAKRGGEIILQMSIGLLVLYLAYLAMKEDWNSTQDLVNPWTLEKTE